MHNEHEVITAFLDDEPFDPQELGAALADPAGRALLIDLLALRRLVQPGQADASMPALSAQPSRLGRSGRVIAVAAALLLAIAGGYVAGNARDAMASPEAPAPTRVVTAAPYVPAGGIQ